MARIEIETCEITLKTLFQSKLDTMVSIRDIVFFNKHTPRSYYLTPHQYCYIMLLYMQNDRKTVKPQQDEDTKLNKMK